MGVDGGGWTGAIGMRLCCSELQNRGRGKRVWDKHAV